MATEQQQIEPTPGVSYDAKVTPLRGRSTRSDWEVTTVVPTEAIERSDIVGQLRAFFRDLDTELDEHSGDPVALAQALARLEAIQADIRYVTGRAREKAAEALHDRGVRRLTVTDVVTVEGTNSVERSNWQHEKVLRAVIRHDWDRGLVNHPNDVADIVLECAGINYWRLTPLRERGINPDDFCDVATDDDGKPTRTPGVKMVHNVVRNPS